MLSSAIVPTPGPASRPHRRATFGSRRRAAVEPLESRRLLTATATVQAVAAVHGIVYHDLDADGTLDANEPRVAGATIYADLDRDALPDPGEPSVLSGNDGSYALPTGGGTFDIRVVAPAPGYVTSQPAGGAHTITVPAGGGYFGIHFGVHTTGAAVITVFNDPDGNGVQTDGELPVVGRTVYSDADANDRLDPGELFLATGADGVVRFEGLRPGAYRFRQVLPPGWTETGQIADPSVRANLVSAGTVTAAVGTRQPPTTATLAGTVYDDANANRLRDAGEPGVAGRTVYLDADHDGAFDPGETTTTTDATGAYAFAAPAPGRHYVRTIVPEGWTRTTPTSGGSGAGAWYVIPQPNDVDDDLHFGTVHAEPASVSGRIYNDLDADGVRDAGEPALAGGRVFIDFDNDGFADIREPGELISDDGRYTIAHLPPGTHLVRHTPPSFYRQTDPDRDDRGVGLGHSVTLAPGENAAVADFGAASHLTTASAIGQVLEDTNGNGIHDPGENQIASNRVAYVDADNDGVLDPGEQRYRTLNNAFVLDGLAPGTHTIRVVTPAGYRQTLPYPPGGGYTVTLAAGQRNSTLNFAFAPVSAPSAISGTFYNDTNGSGRRDPGEPPKTGTVYLDLNNDGQLNNLEPLVPAGAGGTYGFSNVAPGTYTVRARKGSDETFTQPVSGAHAVTVGANQLSAANDFGVIATSRLPAVYGLVFDDTDADGIRDSGEASPPGRTVWLDTDGDGELDAGEPTAVQGIDGFAIRNVLPGTYTLRVVVPAGMRQTFPAGGAGRTITLAPGQSSSGGFFGLAAGADVTPPAVASVFVGHSAWPPLPPALGTRTLPWTTADTIAIRFSEDIRVQSRDLRGLGPIGPAFTFREFRYDTATFTATWVLSEPLRAGRFRIVLDGDAPDGVADGAGNPLHGGAGDYLREIKILPGDATGDGRVNALDLAHVRRRVHLGDVPPTVYDPFADIDLNGYTDAADVAAVRRHLSTTLPPPPSVAAAPLRRVTTTRGQFGATPILPE